MERQPAQPAPKEPGVLRLSFSEADLTPLVETIVGQVLEKQKGRLAFTEAEAAEQLGLRVHVLRDCRLRGEIQGKRVGKKVVYSAEALREFLRRPTE